MKTKQLIPASKAVSYLIVAAVFVFARRHVSPFRARLALAASICGMLLLAGGTASGQFAGGIGTAENPYQITTRQHLEAVNDDLTAHYKLMNDLDLGGTDYENSVIAPNDGSWVLERFTGSFDGNAKVIHNLTIAGGANEWIGLFGRIGSSGRVQNLNLVNMTVSAGNELGGLAGINDGSISACSAMGDVSGYDQRVWQVGGLVGRNYGAIVSSYATGTVSGTGSVGGLAGANSGYIVSSYSTGTVSGSSNVGGLTGGNFGSIVSSHATGTVSGSSNLGGLAGVNHRSIVSSYALGTVNGVAGVGGLVGKNSGSIVASYATGIVDAQNGVGGLTGLNSGAIAWCYAAGAVSGTTSVGGLVGDVYEGDGYLDHSGEGYLDEGNFWDAQTSLQTDSVMGTGLPTAQMKTQASFIAGGWDFVGEDGNGIHDFWTMPPDGYPELHRFSAGYTPRVLAGIGTPVDPYRIFDARDLLAVNQEPNANYKLMNDIDFAGIAFRNISLIYMPFDGHFEGNGHAIRNPRITGKGNCIGVFSWIGRSGKVEWLGIESADIEARKYVGGLAGANSGFVSQSHATGMVSGYSHVGGLAGMNINATVIRCHATVEVHGEHIVAGLVGQGNGTISESFSTGAVSGTSIVGGLVGNAYYITIINCYARGTASGSMNVGGLVGRYTRGGMTHCYSTGEVSGFDDVGGLVGSLGDGGNFVDENNFWNWQASKQQASAMGAPKTTDQMRTASTFIDAGWDFSNVWWMPTAGYPRLAWQRTFSHGDGSPADPYRIMTREHLEAVNDELDKHYILMNDIDLSGESLTRAVIAPRVDAGSPWFTGLFNGNGKVIRNLAVAGGANDDVGLFGRIGATGQVIDLAVEDAVVGGRSRVGILVGRNSGQIVRCRAAGAVTSSSEHAGGLAGLNDGTISLSHATTAVTGDWYAGGLAGFNGGAISDSYARGAVSGAQHVGGLVGRHEAGTIHRCYSTGQVGGTSEVGGLVGSKVPPGDPLNSAWDKDSSLRPTSAMGQGRTTAEMYFMSTFTSLGWDFTDVWRMPAAGYPKLAWQAGFAEGTGAAHDPYLIHTQDQLEAVNDDLTAHYRLMRDLTLNGGYNQSVIAPYFDSTSPRFTGFFDGNGKAIRNLAINTEGVVSFVGLFGRTGVGATIANLHLENVQVSSHFGVGGLAGVNDGAITGCQVDGMVTAASTFAGGLVGINNGMIAGCHGAAVVQGTDRVGGLAGSNGLTGTIQNSQARRAVSGSGSQVGGLVGGNTGTITRSFARGNVTSASQIVGGLVGLNSEGGGIADSYARGAVHGTHHVGGLLGRDAGGTVARCFSTGAVTGTSNLGGLVGSVFDSSSVDTDNYWDTQTSGRGTSAMGSPGNTAAMKTPSTFANWNFIFVWGADVGRNDGYPHLAGNLPARVAMPVFYPRGGVLPGEGRDVTVTCSTPDTMIRYTTDGSDPTPASQQVSWSGIVDVVFPATLKARAYAEPEMGLDPSAVNSALFDGETANGVRLSWLAGHGFALDGSADFSVPPGKTQDVLTHFLADLDPGDPDSVFRVFSIERDAETKRVTVRFEPASPDRQYRLEASDTLAPGSWQPVGGGTWMSGDWTAGTLIQFDADVPRRFYRVAVRRSDGPPDSPGGGPGD